MKVRTCSVPLSLCGAQSQEIWRNKGFVTGKSKMEILVFGY